MIDFDLRGAADEIFEGVFEIWRHTSDLDETDSAAVEAAAVQLPEGTVGIYRDANAAAGVDYWYFVRAIDQAGNVGSFSKTGPLEGMPLPTSSGGTGGGSTLGALAYKDTVNLAAGGDTTGIAPVASGGTGSDTAAGARAALGAAKLEAGALTELDGATSYSNDELRDAIIALQTKINLMNGA